MKPFFIVRTARVVPPVDPTDPLHMVADAHEQQRPRWVVQLDLVTESPEVLRWLLRWAATQGREPPPPDSSPHPDDDGSC